MEKNLTILGAGNAGHALAFDATQHGVNVTLFEHPDFAKSLDGIRKRGGIEAVEKYEFDGGSVPAVISGFQKIHALTTDPKEAMAASDAVAMIVPSFAQEAIFRLVMPYLRDKMMFIILPGNYGSLLFRKIMREEGINKNIEFVETSTIPYAVRIIEPGTVYIEGKKATFSAGSYPVRTVEKFLKLHPLENVLAAGLSNVNMVMHVPTATLGMGPMESRKGQIQFYAEGCSDAVSRVLEKVDEERLSVGRAYGLKLLSFVESANLFYGLKMKSIRDFAANTPVHNRMPNDSPKGPKERYISEDCPAGLVPVYHLGKLAGVECPVIESLIRIDNVYNGVNYFEEGTTLAKLGLDEMTKEEIIKYISS